MKYSGEHLATGTQQMFGVCFSLYTSWLPTKAGGKITFEIGLPHLPHIDIKITPSLYFRSID